MELPASGHDPVLLTEVLELLEVTEGKTIVDCTLGRGGHAGAIAAKLGPEGLLIGMDADPRNLQYAQTRLANVPYKVRLFHANFAQLQHVLEDAHVELVDGILADLGLSTNQLFDPDYGLSFAADAPLDMRIDPRTEITAAEIVNRWGEQKIADLLFQNADERFSRKIAKKIVERRRLSPIRRTGELAQLIYETIGGPRPDRIDPATRTFMALRMAVNQETENLQTLLTTAPMHLKPGGRLAIISFHSTEDRFVKQAFRDAQQRNAMAIVTKKPVIPGDMEQERNPRSRSAKLRVAQRTGEVVQATRWRK
jgi:16S rRNA (cytosine1402-N4)-methyltransferase